MTFKEIGVVGCGAMGADIVQLALKGGYSVVVREMSEELLTKGLDRVKKGAYKLVQKGVLQEQEADGMLARLSGTTAFEDLAACDLIIEAVFEDLQVKKDLFQSLDRVCKKETVFASNTSSLSVTDMAASTSRPAQFVGMHFFNPATVMPLVEVIKTIATDADVLQSVIDFAKSVGKLPVLAKDNAGFIVNLLLTPYLMDAVRAVSEGVATVEHIDMGMRFGCNHPMGPLMLVDFIGLDVLVKGATSMFEEYRDKRYAPPPILKKMVTMGYLGLKSRKGFYDWSDPKHPVPSDLAL
ncbi:MAG: 3-hydroxyacyl-CoA dehydrogenase family protein [Syntrophorhabdales bacterium]|jgi:3-hydroxybutyryl-CoA dehydrogenase